MNQRELRATIDVVQTLVDALSRVQGTTEEEGQQLRTAWRKGAYWLKEWQSEFHVQNPTDPSKEAGGFYDVYKHVAGPMLKAMGAAEHQGTAGPQPDKAASGLPTFSPLPIPPGREACPNCGVRQGLGNCSTCIIRMHRGIEGMENWVALTIWYIGEVPTTSEREANHLEVGRALLWRAKGHHEDLDLPRSDD
jgi:hypothetical protein